MYILFGKGKKSEILNNLIENSTQQFLDDSEHITANMTARGGGVKSIQLIDKADLEPNYYQLEAKFETCDSMGAKLY